MKRFSSLWIAVMLICAILIPTPVFAVDEQKPPEQVSILFTHDMHSHLQPASYTGEGGFAKLKTGIDQVNEEYPGSFLFDGGDFSMGTPYQTIFTTEASELVLMGQMGYDAVTLGNHEFDYKAAGLAAMLNRAAGKDMPALVQSNIDWSSTFADKKQGETGRELYAAMANYGAADYTVVEKNGVRVAVFGIMGEEAISNAPESGVTWRDGTQRAEEIVEEIRRNEDVHLIVCLSHSGLEESGDRGEDVELAKAVPEIDLIISGHSHTTMKKPLVQGNTTIVSAGEYTKALGHVVLKRDGDRYKVDSFRAIPMDDGIAGDEDIQKAADDYIPLIDERYFARFGYSYSSVLASSDFAFKDISRFGEKQGEEPLGNLISDSYIFAVKEAEGDKYEKVDVAVVPAGVVRGSFGKGDITAADAFNVSSLGIGPDGIPGYPLVSIYLTGKEIKAMAEVDITVSPKMPEARLYASGLEYAFNDRRLFLNRVIDIKLRGEDGKTEKLKNDQLYRVVGGLYSCQMLGTVEEASKGFLPIKPKDKNGKEIKDFEKHIIYGDKGEVKEWYALASYIDAFSDNKIPPAYKGPEGRKVDKTGFNPYTLLKQPNNFGLIAGALVMIPIVIIAGIILWLRKRRHDRRGYGRSMFRKMPKRRGGKPVFKERRISKWKRRRSMGRRRRF